MPKPGVPDLFTLRIPYAPPCRDAIAEGNWPFAVLQATSTPILVGPGHGNPNKPPKPDNGKDKPWEGTETPYIPPPQVPGGQGTTASEEGPGTGGTEDPPPPPDVVPEPPTIVIGAIRASGGWLAVNPQWLKRRAAFM